MTHTASESTSPTTAPAAAPLWEPEQEGQLLRNYVAVIFRRRWTALAVFVIVAAVAAVRTFSATPIYEATAQILIESDTPNVTAFDEVLPTNRRALEYFQTQYRLLTSRALARRALEISGLTTEPAFIGTLASAAPLGDGALGGIGRAEGASAPEPSAAELAMIRRFLGGVTIAPIRNSRLVDVTYASPDPAIAQRAANAIVDAYIQQSAEQRSSTNREAASFLSETLNEQRRAVEQSELALQRYREQRDALSLEDQQNIVVGRIAGLNESLTRARTDRIQKQTAYEQAKALGSTGAAPAGGFAGDSVATQRLEMELGDLQQQKAQMALQLGDRHPDMVRITGTIERTQERLRQEAGRIVTKLQTDYEAAAELERAMVSALEGQKAEALSQNRRGLDYSVLERDAVMNRQLYGALLQRAKETAITERLDPENIRIVDRAELPARPARPNRTRDSALGFVLASILAIGAVLTLEIFDTRIKSPDDVLRHLRVPHLGMVPQTAGTDPAAMLLSGPVPQNFVEAFKALRTNILFASADPGPKSLLVSSTAPGEGKTVVSCNLALALAMSGQRVLLIDADMRRPKVHLMFGPPLSPGLSDVLVGNKPVKSAIQATGHANLFIMPAGTLPPDPPELLGSARFEELLRGLGQAFQWIVLDSPPVRPVTDAVVIANRVTSVVFVVGSEMTDAGAAKVAIKHLMAAKAKVAGAVLNRVQLRRHGYYYSHYYGRKDEQYYASRASHG